MAYVKCCSEARRYAGNVHRRDLCCAPGDTFLIYPDSSSFIDVELIEATDLSERSGRATPEGRRRPFSIVFRGPRNILLPERICPAIVTKS